MKRLLLFVLIINCIACSDPNATTEETTTGATTETGASTETGVKKDNDWSKKNLKGAVQSREVWAYQSVIKDGYVNNGPLKGGIKVIYNKDGNIVESISYNEKKEIAYTWKHQYDPLGDCTLRVFEDGRIKKEIFYRYENHKCVEEKEYVGKDEIKKITYAYDSKGLLVEVNETFGEHGKTKTINNYDAKGLKREANIYDGKDVLDLKQLYSYNDKEQLIEQAIFTGKNAPSYKRKFSYDAQGNMLTNLAFGDKGEINASDCFKYEYEYDQQGNWTTRITKNYDDVAEELADQKVVYFD